MIGTLSASVLGCEMGIIVLTSDCDPAMVMLYVRYLAQGLAYERAKNCGSCYSVIVIVISTCGGTIL